MKTDKRHEGIGQYLVFTSEPCILYGYFDTIDEAWNRAEKLARNNDNDEKIVFVVKVYGIARRSTTTTRETAREPEPAPPADEEDDSEDILVDGELESLPDLYDKMQDLRKYCYRLHGSFMELQDKVDLLKAQTEVSE